MMLVATSHLRLLISSVHAHKALSDFYNYQDISSEHYLGTMTLFCITLHRAGC
jgi:hypothetical protein